MCSWQYMFPTALSSVQWCSPPTRPGADSSEAPHNLSSLTRAQNKREDKAHVVESSFPSPSQNCCQIKKPLLGENCSSTFGHLDRTYESIMNKQWAVYVEKSLFYGKALPEGDPWFFSAHRCCTSSAVLCANSKKGKERGNLLFCCNLQRSTDSKFQHVPSKSRAAWASWGISLRGKSCSYITAGLWWDQILQLLLYQLLNIFDKMNKPNTDEEVTSEKTFVDTKK